MNDRRAAADRRHGELPTRRTQPTDRRPLAKDAREMTTRRTGLDRRQDDASEAPHRYYDPHLKGTVVKVLPGEHYVTEQSEEILVTVLGSCVSACIRDPKLGIGGMNHFMLPGEARGRWGEATHEMRYGQFAMEALINDVLKRGGRRERLEVKLFGGANVIRSSLHIGSSNADFVRSFMRAEQLSIAAEDLEGDYPRRIHYYPMTGRVQRLEMRRDPDREVFDSERRYAERLREKTIEGDVELFT